MSKKFLTGIDLARNSLLNAVIQPLASAPSSPVAGLMYFDTTLGQYGVYSGSAWVYLGSNNGTVTGTSVVTANGFAGSVATPGTTPAITLSTTISGLLKGNGTALSAAASGTDYAPATSGSGLLKGNGAGGFSSAAANTDYAPPANPVFTGTVTVPTPASTGAAATKGYVDSAVQGISSKYAAVAATTGAETYTISAGSVTQIAGTVVDGVSPNTGDYVLVMNAPAASGTGTASASGVGTAQPANGLYQVTANTTNLTLSRAADMSGSNSPVGAYVFIAGGTANASAGFVVSAPSTSASFTYGTTSLQFTQFSGAAEVIAGTGLAKNGNTLSLATLNGKYTAVIGDGSSTSITVTHSLGTRAVGVWVYDAVTYVEYDCDVTRTSTAAVTLGFATAPAAGSLVVVVMG